MLNSAESPIEVAPVDFIEMGRDTNSRVDQAAGDDLALQLIPADARDARMPT